MSKLLIGAGIAAIVALGYAFFQYEHRCPTPAEVDKIVADVKSGKLSPVEAEVIARELDNRKCNADAALVRGAVIATGNRNEQATSDARLKEIAAANAAAAKAIEDAKPKCPPIFAKLPDAPLRRGRYPYSTDGSPALPYGIKSIRAWAIETATLDGPTRDSHAKIIEDDAPFWLTDGVSPLVFTDAAKCLRGLMGSTTGPLFIAGFVAGMDPRRKRMFT